MELLEYKRQVQRTSRCEDPPHELRDLWVWLVTRWQSLARALSACDLLEIRRFGEPELRQLWQHARGGAGQDFKQFMAALAPNFSPRSQQIPRGSFLEACAACAPRITFRHWSNTVLLAYEQLSDLAVTLCSGGMRFAGDCDETQLGPSKGRTLKQKVVREEDFIEVLALQEVCQEDAMSWLEALRTSPPKSMVDLDLLTKRIVDQQIDLAQQPEFNFCYDGYERPSDCMPLEDIAVRLIHSFGDLTLAFNLLPKATQVNQTQSRIGSPKLRSVSPQFRGKARPPGLPGAHQPRKADIGAEARQMQSTKVEDVFTLTERQWLHALRGSSQRRLLPDSDAKAEAARQMAWQSQRAAVAAALGMTRPAIDGLHSLFPNLSERLCIAKTAYQPFEAMMVRASLTPHGFFGHRLARDVPVTSVSARHFIKGDVTALCGSRPFVAVIALGAERALANGEDVEMEYQACLEAATAGTAVAMLRAPGSSGGRDGRWALQLCASEDGRNALGTVGPPLPFRVFPRRPGRPSAPFLISTGTSVGGCFLVVAWREPLDEGGAPVLGHDLRLWEQERFMRGEEPLVFSGPDVWPEYHMEGVEPGIAYVLQVRCHNEAGTSEWSTMSEPLTTALKPPSELEKPEAADVGLNFVTLQWGTSEVEIDSYEIFVEPLTSGEQAWVFSVGPPEETEHLCRYTGTKTEATVEGLQARQMYRFRVRGCRKADSGPWSECSDQVYTSSMGTAGASQPSAPRQVEVWKEGMVLEWDAPDAQVARYVVKGHAESTSRNAKTKSPDELLQFQTTDSSTRLTVRGLQGNTFYTFRVFALTSSGLSQSSEPGKFCALAMPPGPPKSLSVVEVEQTQLRLRWEPPEDDGGAHLEKYFLEVVDWNSPTERMTKEFGGDETEGIVDGLQGNQRYFMRLTAHSRVGVSRCTELLATSGPVVPGMPGIPKLMEDPTGTSVNLSWSAPLDTGGSSILGYTLQGILCDCDMDYHALDVTSTKGSVHGLQPESRYKFRVCARNCAGVGRPSDWSPVLRTAPKAPETPARPTAISASSTSIEVTWGEALPESPPMLWEVAAQRADTENGKMPGPTARFLRCKAPPVLVKSLARFTTYVFSVRAMGEGGRSEWSEPSEAMGTSSEWTDEEITDFLLPRFGGSLANVFRGLDTNCDGFIREGDLYHGFQRWGLSELSRERVAQLFATLDSPNRGMVTLRDFSKCLSRATAPQRSSPRARSPANGAHTPNRSPTRSVNAGPIVPRRSMSPPMCLTRAQRASFELTYVSPNHR